MSTVISVEHVSKAYRLGMIGGATLKEDFARWWTRLRGQPDPLLKIGQENHQQRIGERFLALDDVSFQVEEGEVMGIIGRNGAGKSTLLKILSQVTAPTSGEIKVKGRIASLLEVGTGFHPELTGRENIFLNGAILGMTRAEIRHKFDEIVAFSEIEEFLDTPVKRYSSGMYVRLAFAVAAHLEPEILVVDEVLAVGDAAFQNKCLGRMADIAQGGRTVLFVSHNIAAVQRLCTHCVLLSKGRLLDCGQTAPVISQYLQPSELSTENSLNNFGKRTGTGTIRFTSFHLEDGVGRRIQCVQSGMDFSVVLGFCCPNAGSPRQVDVGFSLHLPDTTILAVLYSSYTGQVFSTIPNEGEFHCSIRSLPLKEGKYLIGIRVVANGDEADWPQGFVGAVDVVAGDFFGTGVRGFSGPAPVLLDGSWKVMTCESVPQRA